MKKFLMVVGAIAVFGFIAMIVLVTFAVFGLNETNKEAKAYVAESIEAIATQWDENALLARATPELREYFQPGQLETFLGDSSRTIGGLETLGEINCISNSSVTTSEGRKSSSECTGEAAHERGRAEYRVSAVKKDGEWRLNSFYVTYYPEEDGSTEV